MDAAVRASAPFFGVGGSKDAMVCSLSTAAHCSSAAVREGQVMTVSWSAARAWRCDGVSAGSASARAASLQSSCELVEHRELRALWEFLRFAILAARRAVAFALRCCCKHVSAKAASPLAPRCAPMCLSLVLCWESSCTQPKQASARRVQNDVSEQSKGRGGPSRLVTGSVASSHLSLCEPAPSLRYRLSQCSAAAAVIFLHGKASSSADLLRCSHYTEA